MKEYLLKGDLCPNCARKIEDRLNSMTNVNKAVVDFISKSISIDGEIKQDEVLNIVQSIEPDVVFRDDTLELDQNLEHSHSHEHSHDHSHSHSHEHGHGEERIDFKSFEFISLAAGVAFLVLSFILNNNYLGIISALIAGSVIFKNAIKVLRSGNGLDEQVLMSVSCIGAILIGEAKEGAAVMVLYRIGEFLTDLAIDKATKDLRNTVSQNKRTARVILSDGSSKVLQDTEVEVGSKIEVEPFEMVSLDSILLDEYASIDTSSFTGESEPRVYNKGETIPAGSIVVGKKAMLQVLNDASNSQLKRMDDLVKEAGQKKSKQEKFLTVFARVYTPIVVGLAVLITVVPLIVGGDVKAALKKSLAFLVTSCPCSVVLGVPLSYAVGLGALSRKGILVKGSQFIDATSHIKTIGLDKTGTVTENRLELIKVEPKADYSENDLRKLMAIGEGRSTHPIASAFKIEGSPDATDLQEIPGKGIDFSYDNKRFKIRGGGKSLLIHLYEEDNLIGEFYLEEKLKSDAMDVIRDLKNLNINTILVSGDSEDKVKSLSNILGFDSYQAEMTPEDKLNFMLSKRKDGHMSFVGDGINDSAVLEASNVGISMGKMGSDAAVKSSDVVIMDDDIRKIPMVIRASKRILTNVKFIVGISLLAKLGVLLAIYLGVKNGMYLAVLADVGVTMLCVLIALINNKSVR